MFEYIANKDIFEKLDRHEDNEFIAPSIDND